MTSEFSIQRGVFELIICLQVSSIIGYCISLRYILRKLKLSKHVTKVLVSGIVPGIVLTFMSGISITAMYYYDIRSTLLCGLAFDTMIILYTINLITGMILSILRQHMAKTVGENKVVNDIKIKNRLNKAYLLEFLVAVVSLLLSISFGIHNTLLTANCSSYGDFVQLPFYMASYFIILSITFHHDIKLLNFVKEYNERTKGQMKLWSFQSSNKEEIKEIVKSNIPLISTLLTVGAGISLMVLIFVASLVLGGIKFGILNAIISSALNVIYMPLITAYGMKNQSNKKDSNIYVPSGLHFHDDTPIGDDLESELDNPRIEDNENFENPPIVFNNSIDMIGPKLHKLESINSNYSKKNEELFKLKNENGMPEIVC